MEIFLAILLFCLGLVLLIKGGDLFVDGATGIAHRFHLPEILIGATVVSIGTTLPEVMVSATAAVEGQSQTAYGNAIGSVICNTALIAAFTIAVKPAEVDRKTLILPVIFFFIASAFYTCIAYFANTFSRWTGIVLLCLFVIYMVVTVRQAIKNPVEPKVLTAPDGAEMKTTENFAASKNAEVNADAVAENNAGAIASDAANAAPAQKAAAEEKSEQEKAAAKKASAKELAKQIIFLIIGAAAIAVGARLLVDNGSKIAIWLGVPEAVVALTFVALGTSLPELITAITSLIKGHGALSLGNVIGANLFNLVLVSGIAITLRPFDVPVANVIAGINSSLLIDIPVMNAVMLILTLPALIKNKLYRWQGVVLLVIYAAFCTLQFVL